MNGLSCSSLCHLLCCPPLPSRIAAKLAFLPPVPSYLLTKENGKPKLTLSAFNYSNDNLPTFLMNKVDVFTANTRKGNKIVMLYMQTNPSTKLTFLLSHGNAVDIGLMLNFMHDLSCKLGVNMMCYDYSGYGASTGKPLEKHLYADAECAIELLQKRFSVPLEQIVLYGQSIGTVPTVYLATRYRVAAVVLHSPLMSGLRVAFPRVKRNYCCDVFPNLFRSPRILSPTLIIHGTCDEVIGVNHGRSLFAALPESCTLEPLFLIGGGHNDCEMFPQYLTRLIELVHQEMPHLAERARQENLTMGPTMANRKQRKAQARGEGSGIGSSSNLSGITPYDKVGVNADAASVSSSASSELNPMLSLSHPVAIAPLTHQDPFIQENYNQIKSEVCSTQHKVVKPSDLIVVPKHMEIPVDPPDMGAEDFTTPFAKKSPTLQETLSIPTAISTKTPEAAESGAHRAVDAPAGLREEEPMGRTKAGRVHADLFLNGITLPPPPPPPPQSSVQCSDGGCNTLERDVSPPQPAVEEADETAMSGTSSPLLSDRHSLNDAQVPAVMDRLVTTEPNPDAAIADDAEPFAPINVNCETAGYEKVETLPNTTPSIAEPTKLANHVDLGVVDLLPTKPDTVSASVEVTDVKLVSTTDMSSPSLAAVH